MSPLRLILASASPARLATLRQAGLDPEAIISGVDESNVDAGTPAALARRLAQLKAEAVADRIAAEDRSWTVVIGCDSVLELDGGVYGKPQSPQVAVERWQRMSGRVGVLHTGHHVMVIDRDSTRVENQGAATRVHFADLTDDEITAYVATGEPLQVAGGFTVDGLGGPFVSSIEGDHHNVVGISLPLLRTMLATLGVPWPTLWIRHQG